MRSDGTLRDPVTMWVVRDGENLYLRSVNGHESSWFRVFVLNARPVIPTWLRRLTLVVGIAGIGGLAYSFYLVMLWGIVVGLWLVADGRRAPARSLVPEPIA